MVCRTVMNRRSYRNSFSITVGMPFDLPSYAEMYASEIRRDHMADRSSILGGTHEDPLL